MPWQYANLPNKELQRITIARFGAILRPLKEIGRQAIIEELKKSDKERREEMFQKVMSFWKKEDKKGTSYLQGQIDLGTMGAYNLAIYQNKRSNQSKGDQPDYTMYIVTKNGE